MMISSKLKIPLTGRTLVPRPRLMRKLDEGLHAKLTLVSAPAGYGKTTALSDWVKQSSALAAWISLDKLDNDWSQFWSCMITSIGSAIPGFGHSISFLPEKETAESYETAMWSLLGEMNQIADELVIILDDFHFIELPVIQESFRYLLDQLPRHIHFYIASRRDLAIPTARLLAQGAFHPVTMQDLRFELDEGMMYFRDTADLSLTKEQVTELCQQTEGWVSGLQLAAIRLRRSANIAESIRQFTGQQEQIADYLLEEVFRHLAAPLREFLLKTSILSRMNASLCHAVTGHMNSQDHLERLEHLKLFIIPLDEQRSWYRYHHMFAEFLQRMAARTNPEQRQQAHVCAANWLEEHAHDEEAVEHYIKGGRAEDAVRLIEKNLSEFIHTKSSVLMNWIAALPARSYTDKPMIEMFYISVQLTGGEWSSALQRAEQAHIRYLARQGQWPEAEWKIIMGNIYFFCGILSYLQRDLLRTSMYFERLDEYFLEENHGGYFHTMGRTRYQGEDKFNDLLTLNHDLQAIEPFLLRWLKAWEDKEYFPFIGYLYVTYCKLLYEWDRLEEAEQYLAQAMQRADLPSYVQIWVQLICISARLQLKLGHPGQASKQLLQLKYTIESPDYELIMCKIEAEQANLALCQGSYDVALDWAEECGLAPTDRVSMNRMSEYLILARVLAAGGRSEEAISLLEKLYRVIDKDNRLRERIRVLIVQCIAHHYSGQAETALVKLGTALQLAESGRYIRSFADEGPVMAELLSLYLKKQLDGKLPQVTLAYIKQLLHALHSSKQDEAWLKGVLTGQEIKVLQLIKDGLLNKEIAHKLNITTETVKFHLKNIYRKLGAHNRVQAVQLANQWLNRANATLE
ncbi:LuxR C-terminal-related transcriptional regulator [Paenibacillus sp. 1011MAR3C5]|uniref:LuxR C-terminal-related transcriptional regulator n=1 Tax=Paenibacillus sp. 1011MAR3C5 TaxID=1675787 RepID=UPI0016022E49|nr:LuxR C-terminal-related transcriptional regulator [Paenibacillus sp. 1011MAR3C5]